MIVEVTYVDYAYKSQVEQTTTLAVPQYANWHHIAEYVRAPWNSNYNRVIKSMKMVYESVDVVHDEELEKYGATP